MVEHKFGGPQTDFKLDVLRQYLEFFTTVLKRQNFELWYIVRLGPPIVEHQRVPGSSLIALETLPRFDRFILLKSINGAIERWRRFVERILIAISICDRAMQTD